ncbi:1-acyl-sn-glycerol-3-phosphate acyltransferase [Planctomycetota bacterium]
MKPGWWAERARGGDPGRPNPRLLCLFRWLAAPGIRLMHRPVLEGTENLPVDRPFLLVANHSAGLAIGEIFSFIACYTRRFGLERPLTGMAHPFGFHLWPFSYVLRGLGAIPSTYAAAEEALRADIPVLIFPGGDHEACRPVWQASRVDLAGRRGFLRIARKAQVPIVPMGIRGSHYTAPILWRSRLVMPWLAVVPVVFGVKRFPLTLLAVIGVVLLVVFAQPALGWPLTILLSWLWVASPFPFLPWVPSTIRMRIGKPIPPGELFDASERDELQAAYDTVQGAIQDLVLGTRSW